MISHFSSKNLIFLTSKLIIKHKEFYELVEEIILYDGNYIKDIQFLQKLEKKYKLFDPLLFVR